MNVRMAHRRYIKRYMYRDIINCWTDITDRVCMYDVTDIVRSLITLAILHLLDHLDQYVLLLTINKSQRRRHQLQS